MATVGEQAVTSETVCDLTGTLSVNASHFDEGTINRIDVSGRSFATGRRRESTPLPWM